MKSVSDKVLFITGGAGGIGLAIVKEFLTNGAKGVAIIDISEEAGQEAIRDITATFGENKVIFIKTDVTVKTELEDAFETTVRTYNQLDIVINNAGIINEHDWEKTIAVNLIAVIQGTYMAMQKYLPKYKSEEEGIIINTSSTLGFCTIQPAPIYCTTKHGLVGLGKALGGEEFYKKYKVRVLTICPGLVNTSLIDPEKRNDQLVFPHKMEEEAMALNSMAQSPECVAEAVIEAIKNGKNGSLWVTKDEQPAYEIEMPVPEAMRVSK